MSSAPQEETEMKVQIRSLFPPPPQVLKEEKPSTHEDSPIIACLYHGRAYSLFDTVPSPSAESKSDEEAVHPITLRDQQGVDILHKTASFIVSAAARLSFGEGTSTCLLHCCLTETTPLNAGAIININGGPSAADVLSPEGMAQLQTTVSSIVEEAAEKERNGVAVVGVQPFSRKELLTDKSIGRIGYKALRLVQSSPIEASFLCFTLTVAGHTFVTLRIPDDPICASISIFKKHPIEIVRPSTWPLHMRHLIVRIPTALNPSLTMPNENAAQMLSRMVAHQPVDCLGEMRIRASRAEVHIAPKSAAGAYRRSSTWAGAMSATKGQSFVFYEELRFAKEILKVARAHENFLALRTNNSDHDSGISVMLVTGPSASGKTTFTHRVALSFQALDRPSCIIGTDEYYRDIADPDYPLHPNGKLNHECIEALRIDRFAADVAAIVRGEVVEIPSFDFVNSRPRAHGKKLHLPRRGVLLIEGIFAFPFGEFLDAAIPVYRVFISPVTTCLAPDDHAMIQTEHVRALRRIARDNSERGRNAAATIKRLAMVQQGTIQNVLPKIPMSNYIFNSCFAHELAVLKSVCVPLLEEVTTDDKEALPVAEMLLDLLSFVEEIPEASVPDDSILREFIGGSIFDEHPANNNGGEGNGESARLKSPKSLFPQWPYQNTKHGTAVAPTTTTVAKTLGELLGAQLDSATTIAAMLNGCAYPLDFTADEKNVISVLPISRDSPGGQCIAMRTLALLFHVAAQLTLKQTAVVSSGMPCEDSAFTLSILEKDPSTLRKPTSEETDAIQKCVREMISSNEQLKVETVSLDAAQQYFKEKGKLFSLSLLSSLHEDHEFSMDDEKSVDVVICRDVMSLLIGAVAPDASCVPQFDVCETAACVTVALPGVGAKYAAVAPGLYEWRSLESRVHQVLCVGDLNEKLKKNEGSNIVQVASALATVHLHRVARFVIERRPRVVLVGGVVSSGKTRFLNHLRSYLEYHGILTATLSLDDFTATVSNSSMGDKPKADEACPRQRRFAAIDYDRLNSGIIGVLEGEAVKLSNGRQVNLPLIEAPSVFSARVLIVEGLGALSVEIAPSVIDKAAFLVAPMPIVNIDEANPVEVSLIQKLRQIWRHNEASLNSADLSTVITKVCSVDDAQPAIESLSNGMYVPDVVATTSETYEPALLRTRVLPLLTDLAVSGPHLAADLVRQLGWHLPFPDLQSRELPTLSSQKSFSYPKHMLET